MFLDVFSIMGLSTTSPRTSQKLCSVYQGRLTQVCHWLWHHNWTSLPHQSSQVCQKQMNLEAFSFKGGSLKDNINRHMLILENEGFFFVFQWQQLQIKFHISCVGRRYSSNQDFIQTWCEELLLPMIQWPTLDISIVGRHLPNSDLVLVTGL